MPSSRIFSIAFRPSPCGPKFSVTSIDIVRSSFVVTVTDCTSACTMARFVSKSPAAGRAFFNLRSVSFVFFISALISIGAFCCSFSSCFFNSVICLSSFGSRAAMSSSVMMFFRRMDISSSRCFFISCIVRSISVISMLLSRRGLSA